jgi:hypothetical protein
MADLVEKVKEQAEDRANAYGQTTVVQYRVDPLTKAATLECTAVGDSNSTLKVMQSLKREVSYKDGNKALVPLVQLSSTQSKRLAGDDVVKMDVNSSDEANNELYRLLADANYGPISPEIAIKGDSWLAQWIESMFDAPLDYKAYVSGVLNANCFSDFSKKDVKIYIADFTKVGVTIVRDGKRFQIRKNKEGVTGVFGGQDGSALFAGPDAKTMQFRLMSLHGIDMLSADGENTSSKQNMYAKGLAALSYLSSVEPGNLVFDSERPIDQNVIVLDINSVKGLFATDVVKKKIKDAGVYRLHPIARSLGEDSKLFVEITKINKNSKTSGTYQWAAVLNPDGLDMDRVKSMMPKGIVESELTETQKTVMNTVSELNPELNAQVLSGKANRNQVLSYLVSYLPKMRTRKCVMVSIPKLPNGKEASSFTVLSDDGSVVETFPCLKRGQIADISESDEFVVGRNPMLTPAGVKILVNNHNAYLREIYNLEENVNTIFTDVDCKDLQADDDGDDNACDDNPILLAIVKRHQKWISRSIFSLGVNIENDKKNRIVEKGYTISKIISKLAHTKDGTTETRKAKKKEAYLYANNFIAGVEQAVVGLSSDTSVNILAQVHWVKWDGRSENTVVNASKRLLKDSSGTPLFDVVYKNACKTFGSGETPYIWIPRDINSLRLLLLYYVSVWFTQTAIDWKKRAYRVLCVLYLVNGMSYSNRNLTDLYDKVGADPDLVKAIKHSKESTFVDAFKNVYLAGRPSVEIDACKQELLEKAILKNADSYLLCDLLGGLIGSQEAVTPNNLDAIIGPHTHLLQPESDLFWDVKLVNIVFSALIKSFGADPSRKWKSLAKNAFAIDDAPDALVSVMEDEALKVYNDLHKNVNSQCLLGKMLGKTLEFNKIPSLVKGYNSFTELNKDHKAWLRNQTEEFKEWVNHLTITLQGVHNTTNVENVLDVNLNVKSFQNFLRLNDLKFDRNLILALCGINASRADQIAEKQAVIQTMFEYAEIIDDAEKKYLMDVEDGIMNILDEVAFNTLSNFCYKKWQEKGSKLELQINEFQKPQNMSFSAWFMSGWKSGVFKKVNDLCGNVEDFVKEYPEMFKEALWSRLRREESLNTVLAWCDVEIEIKKSRYAEEVRDVIVGNIARTLRTLDYWKVSKDFMSIRTNAKTWRDKSGLPADGRFFNRFKSHTNPYQLIEKLILEKGWTPNDVNMHQTLFRPILEKNLSFQTKDGFGSYFSWKQIKSWTMTGTKDQYSVHELATGICGSFSD